MQRFHDPFIIPGQAKHKKQLTVNEIGRSSEVTSPFLAGNTLWLGRLVPPLKLKLLWLIICLTFFILLGRLFYLQFLKGEDFRSLAEGNRVRLELIPAARGIIFDHVGVPLVENVPTFSLFFQAKTGGLSKEEKETTSSVLKDLGLSEEEINVLFNNESYLPIPVKENLNYETALTLLLKINESSSLKLIIDPRRQYRPQAALAHLLGYTSRITKEEKDAYLELGYQLTEKVGRRGVEETYQALLRGKDGKKQIEVDAYGRESKVLASEPPLNGQNLILGLDAGLQEKINETLKRLIPHRAGAVIALDPTNGKVRALVSWPTFDNNDFSQGLSLAAYQAVRDNPLKPLFNRAISGTYPSGSTIKIVLGLAGLEEKIINQNTQINSVGGVWYDKWFFPDWKSGGHGLTNLVKAIAESVNSYFYYLALEDFEGHRGLGLEKILSWFRKFNLGAPTGIDLQGEQGGFVPTAKWKEETKGEVWYPGDTLHLAIGQGDLLVTPLQVALFTSVVASGGTIYQPQTVEKIINPQAHEEKIIEPKVLKANFLNSDNLRLMASAMRAAVTSGSARRLNALPVKVAGKTGTAQSISGKLSHAWFTGYLPYENPSLVLTVLVEEGGEGSETAVPIAQEIISWYATNRLPK